MVTGPQFHKTELQFGLALYTASLDCTPGRSAVAGHRQLLPDTRLRLNKVFILQGRSLYWEIVDDCIRYKQLRKRYIEVHADRITP